MTLGATAADVPQERLLVTRKLRVAVGPEREIVEVQAGQPWPADAGGKVDVLIRTGMVVRFDENGQLDPRSYPFARRLGISPPPLYPVRTFLQRARALPQFAQVDGRRIRVLPGTPDDANLGICVVGGRAYVLVRGAPDLFAAREALRLSLGGGTPAPRRRSRKGQAKGQRRRRRRKE